MWWPGAEKTEGLFTFDKAQGRSRAITKGWNDFSCFELILFLQKWPWLAQFLFLQDCNSRYGNRPQQFCVLASSRSSNSLYTNKNRNVSRCSSLQSFWTACQRFVWCNVFFYYIFVLLCLFPTRMLRLINVFLLKWTLLVSQNFEEHCLLHVTF